MWFAYLAAFASAVFYGGSAVIEGRSARATPIAGRSGKRAAVRATIRPLYLGGMVLSAVGWVSALIALRRLPLFAVQSIAAGSIGVVVLIAWVHTRQAPTRRIGSLLAVLGLGLVLLAVSAAPSDPVHVAWLFRALLWVGVVGIAFGAVMATRQHGARGAALLGVVSGLADAVLALAARTIHVKSLSSLLHEPIALAFVPCAVIGVVAFAGALQRGSASTALACQQATLTVVPSVIGLIVLGDRPRHGFFPETIAGLVITIVAVIILTLSDPIAAASEPVPPAAPGAAHGRPAGRTVG
jgi:hypothetical protein